MFPSVPRIALTLALSGVTTFAAAQPDLSRKPASTATQAVFRQYAPLLAQDDRKDFADAERGLIATYPKAEITAPDGHVVWRFKDYQALKAQPAPSTVNPSSWRQVQLNAISGLFLVAPSLYQIRGFDGSNMTIVEGRTGLIIIDPLMTTETAAAGLETYFTKRPRRPVVAVIYTHSHIDHFGGVKGVTTEADVRAGKTAIIAPVGFLEAAVSENVMAGAAMTRRTAYFIGMGLSPDAKGAVDAGLGMGAARGTTSLIAPTETIDKSFERRVIDGVAIDFQLALNTEAPAEMVMFFPKQRVLLAAEIATHTAHNLLTPRGALVRDACAWWKALDALINRFGGQTDVVIASHHWPTWGHDRSVRFLEHQRDFYKFINDQSLHLANQGLTMNEIAEQIALPPGLAQDWALRDYYGTLRGNAKAVYQRYLGWYDGNPANLQALPPVESARKYVEYMGGAQAVLTRARADFAKGEYRWVAEALNRLVFADPGNLAARALQADTLEQLGYQQESAVYRNMYLQGAQELRNGVAKGRPLQLSSQYIGSMTGEMLLDYMGVMLDAGRAQGKSLAFNLTFTDTKQSFAVRLENSVLVYSLNATPPATSVSIDRQQLGQLLGGDPEVAADLGDSPNSRALVTLLGLLTPFGTSFAIVTP